MRHALDYAKYGKLSAKTQIEDNTSSVSSYLNNNEGIELAIKSMSKEECELYKKGRDIFFNKYSKDRTSEDKDAVAYYVDLHRTLQNTGSNATNLTKWENMMVRSENPFVDSLVRHRGMLYNSSFADIAKDIDNMSEKDWNYNKRDDMRTRGEFIDMIQTLGKSESEVDKLVAFYDQKMYVKTYAEAKDVSIRSVIDHIYDHVGDRPAIIAAIEKMSKDEQLQYRIDGSFRQKLASIANYELSYKIKATGDGMPPASSTRNSYQESARDLLAQIDDYNEPKEDIIYKLQHIAASAAADKPVQAADVIEKAFTENPDLQRKVNDPRPSEEAYSAAFKVAARTAGGSSFDSLIGPMLDSAMLRKIDSPSEREKALHERLTFHDGIFIDDIERIVQDLHTRVPVTELATLEFGTTSRALFGEKYLAFLNKDQQAVVTSALQQKEMRLEDKIRAKYLGWGGSANIVGLLKEIEPKSEKPEDINKFREQIAKCREEYSRKYSLNENHPVSLDVDLLTKLGAESKDYEEASRVLNYGLSTEQRANIARTEIQKTLSGWGASYLATVGRSATGDQALAANNAVVKAMTNLNAHIQEMPADQVLALQTRLAEVTKVALQATDNHAESKHAAAEYTAMAVTALAGGLTISLARAALIKAGVEGTKASLLLGLAACTAGGITNPLVRSNIEGKSYDASLTNIAMQSGEGAVQAMLLLAPQSIASAFGIGSEAAASVMEGTALKLEGALGKEAAKAFLSPETKEVLRRGILDSLQEAIATNKEKVSEQTMRRLIEKLTKQASANSVPQEIRHRIPRAIKLAFDHELEGMPKEIAHRFSLHHGLNTIAGAGGGAVSSFLEGARTVDPNQSFDENARQILGQVILGTGSAAAGSLAIGLAVDGMGRAAKKLFKKKNQVHPEEIQADQVEREARN